MRAVLRPVATAVVVPALAYAALRSLRRPEVYRWAGRVVVITGGSRGLGLVLARAFTARGARVALLARDAAELTRARTSLPPTAAVVTVPCDVRDPHQARAAVDEVVATWQRVDVLVNNAGVMMSAPWVETSDADFRDLLDVHVWGTLHMSRAALPHLNRRRQARIVNITSIGGKIPVPHLSAYCASKFAQAGLSAVMGEELRASGVRVVTVYPGLMRTGSHLNAQFKGRLTSEFAVYATAAALPGVSMGAERAAQSIVRATERGQSELVVPWTVRRLATVAALAPRAAHSVLATIGRLQPRGSPARGGLTRVRGLDVGLPAPVQAIAVLGERAADRNNERRARRLD